MNERMEKSHAFYRDSEHVRTKGGTSEDVPI
jgi:hypothetical protein